MPKKYITKDGSEVEVSDELYKYLKKSDRKIEYIEKDLKRNNYKIDKEEEKVIVTASREDSLDRLMENGMDYPQQSSDFGESIDEKIMLAEALEKLSEKERYIIEGIFRFGKSERELAEELKISQSNVNKKKRRILRKLYKLMN